MSVLELISELRKVNVYPKLDEGRLKLAGNTQGISQELLNSVKQNKEQLIDFLLESSVDSSESTPIKKVQIQDYYALSNAQKRIWVLSQFEGGNSAYIISTALYLKGEVIKENLEKAVQQSIDRHESLRTGFNMVNDEPVQIVNTSVEFTIDYLDYAGRKEIKNLLKEQTKQIDLHKFNLSIPPLLAVKLIRISEQEHAMIFIVHHIVSDGWTVGVLLQEVMQNYRRICLNSNDTEPALEIQYKDFTAWLKDKIDGQFGERSKKFWSSKNFSDVDPLSLPGDFPRPEINNFQGAVHKAYFDHDFYRNIELLARQNRTTVFNVFRSALSTTLHKWSMQKELIIGTPVAGRSHHQLADQIGLYVNTLPMKSEYNGEQSFSDYLKGISTDSLELFKYQDYPLDLIIEEEGVQRDPSRNPLFDVLMVVQNNAIGDGTIQFTEQHGFNMYPLDNFIYGSSQLEKEDIAAKFDLNFNFASEPNGKYYLEIEYRTTMFKAQTIQRFFKMFMSILEQAISTPERALKDFSIVDKAEIETILNTFNKPIHSHAEENIVALFTKNLEERHDQPAAIFKNNVLTYKELHQKSDAFAGFFTEKKVSRVAFFINRSEAIVPAVVGALKSQTTYVPIDVNYPDERIEYILNDAEVDMVFTDAGNQSRIAQLFNGEVSTTENIENAAIEFKPVSYDKESVAYLIYTSGSTGKPKGVQITHRNVVAFLKWSDLEFQNTPYELMYAVTSYCFDLSVFEMLLPLVQGKTIRVLNSAIDIPDAIKSDKKVLINTVPSVVRGLLEQRMEWDNVVALNMAGEPVPKHFKDALDYNAFEVRNLYGPSEDTTYSTFYRFANDNLPYIPIGVPVGDTQAYVLDEHQKIVPIGVDGEIYLSGESVAKGYLNKPELTSEKFLPNPFAEGKTMYRTGDVGRWNTEGQLLFTGRIDDQVKVRGYRIELGEIQYKLEQLEEVNEAVVIVADLDGDKEIVAYYTTDAEVSENDLATALKLVLPAYMVPGVFMQLQEIPLNSNGKVDKKKLPVAVRDINTTIVDPVTELEHQLLAIWKETLMRDEFGVTNNFFDLGGHSLKATKLRSMIQDQIEKEISMNEIFTYPTIIQQADLLQSRSKMSVRKIEKVESTEQDLYELSFAQERLWVLTKFDEASRAYHMPAVFEVAGGNLDVERLNKAILEVINKHESLRTIFTEVDNQPFQKIVSVDKLDFKVEELELTSEANLKIHLQEDWNKAFDLTKGPLLRCEVLALPDRQFVSFNMHHIISDGWSIGVLFQDVAKAYRSQELSHLDIQYKDFSIWQKAMLAPEVMEEQLNYWRTKFENGVKPLELPFDNHRPEIKTYNGDRVRHIFTHDLLESVKKWSVQSGVTPFMQALANVNILLKKLSNQNEFAVGTPVSGRDAAQLQEQIGFYVNTLPLSVKLDGSETYSAFLQRTRKDVLQAFEYQNFPFELLVEELQPRRDMSRSPLFDIMVAYQNFDVLESDTLSVDGNIAFKRMDFGSGVTKYDLLFSFTEEGNNLVLELEFNTDLFERKTVEKFIERLEAIFTIAAKNPEIAIKDISTINAEEKKMLLKKADRTQVGFDQQASIVSMFKKAVELYPDNCALKVGDKTISYKELDALSGKLAFKIKNDFSLEKEDLVVLHNTRSEWMIISILAVLKAGGVYVPVDPQYPASRIDYILSDSQAKLVLFDEILEGDHKNRTVFDVSSWNYEGEELNEVISPDQLAYVIYTSGTTGNPKGVLIEHRNVTRLMATEDNLFDFNAADKWSLFHSYCFDFSVWEMYGALLFGGTLVMVPKEVAQDSQAFYDFIVEEGITVLNQTPTAFRSLSLNNEDRLDTKANNLRYIIFGGEALMPTVLEKWNKTFPDTRLINMYGITETTVHVTYKEITSDEIRENKSNIGEPIPTLSCYVLDSDLQPTPVGVIGELCVGGAGVARGYHNRAELTAEKFVENPFGTGGKIYRSGDFARVLPTGDLEYIGRKDDQVKIRGHRIELPEVEEGVKELASIKDAVVLTSKNSADEYELVAYVILEDSSAGNPVVFRNDLSGKLPGYMIPSHFVVLDDFPKTSNGKLDKSALPKVNGVVNRSNDYVAPSNEIEEKIVAIWKEVLDVEEIGVKDNFFDLGGHSLKATRVISKIQEEFGVKIDLKNLFIDPTVEHLSGFVETLQWMENSTMESMESEEDELII